MYVPLNSECTYDATKRFARAVARGLSANAPNVVDVMARERRVGKVFVDWSQNDAGKSTIAPYSLRGLWYPTVSLPVTWDEVAAAVDSGDARRLVFVAHDVAPRIEQHGDLFDRVLTVRQTLPI